MNDLTPLPSTTSAGVKSIGEKPKMMVKTADIVNSDLWRLFPVINCDRAKDIPVDYPGAMGVPITFMDKIGRNDGSSGFLVIDLCRPRLNGRQLYPRLIIRNLRPQLPDEIDLIEWLNNAGVECEIEVITDAAYAAGKG